MEKIVFLRNEPQGIMIGLANKQGSENFITLNQDQVLILAQLIKAYLGGVYE